MIYNVVIVLLSVVGYGSDDYSQDLVRKDFTTLDQCVQFCEKKWKVDGYEWNGVQWRWGWGGVCTCKKNAQGLREGDDSLYYQFLCK